MPVNAAELLFPVSALGLAATAFWRAGRLFGAVEAQDRRLDKVEAKQEQAVTRAELDARFAAVESKLDMVLRLLESRE